MLPTESLKNSQTSEIKDLFLFSSYQPSKVVGTFTFFSTPI
jgi:hypothetical protein